MKKLIFIILFFFIILMVYGYIAISLTFENANLFEWDNDVRIFYLIAYPLMSIVFAVITYTRK